MLPRRCCELYRSCDVYNVCRAGGLFDETRTAKQADLIPHRTVLLTRSRVPTTWGLMRAVHVRVIGADIFLYLLICG
jgi:hypothetical protein